MKKNSSFILISVIAVFSLVSCQKAIKFSVKDFVKPPLVVLNATNAVLIAPDQEPPAILFEKFANEEIPPASMTKLVTALLLVQKCVRENISLDSTFIVPAMADYRNLPRDSSLMFLTAGSRVSIGELLSGLMVPSGNDAAYAVAHYVSGGVKPFVSEMNRVSTDLLSQYVTHPATTFVDPSGYSNNNKTTPLEFAYLSKALVDLFESLGSNFDLFNYTGLEEFTYAGVRQFNHNELIGRYKGVVGLKTGFINKSGANVSLLVEEGDTRFIAVLMGGPGENHQERGLMRSIDASRLITWGLSEFIEWKPALSQKIAVKGGEFSEIVVAPLDDRKILFSREELSTSNVIINLPKSLSKKKMQKLKLGSSVGSWSLLQGDQILLEESPFIITEVFRKVE